jgi:hypothetical protein
MIKMPDTKAKYFSVKHSTKIMGARYIPSVCYPLSQGLQTVIGEMAAKDMARIYPEKVRFVTGVPYPVEKPETSAAAPQSSSVPVPRVKTGSTLQPDGKKGPGVSDKPGRKSGRSGYITQKGREFE